MSATLQGNPLAELARPEANERALIQNGSDPEVFSSDGITQRLVEFAGSEANEPALIQNGSDPEVFSSNRK